MKKLFSLLTEQAKESPRLRMNYDLRTSENEESQRMLNAIEPGTIIPIHRYKQTNEVIVILKGKARQILYNENGAVKESFIMSRCRGNRYVYSCRRMAFYRKYGIRYNCNGM